MGRKEKEVERPDDQGINRVGFWIGESPDGKLVLNRRATPGPASKAGALGGIRERSPLSREGGVGDALIGTTGPVIM